MKKKVLALIMASVLVIGSVIGGTFAWLSMKTGTVQNVFTVGNINITLAETKNDFKMVPGQEIKKDPLVTVKGGSEDCWLFIKVVESANLKSFISYTMDSSWTKLQDGVYYREVANSVGDQPFNVLTNDMVKVLESVDKAAMDDITNNPASAPSLTFTAYAVQRAGITSAADAWSKTTN